MKDTLFLSSALLLFFTTVADAFTVNSKRTRSTNTAITSEVSAIIRREFRDVWEEENNDKGTQRSTTTTTTTKRLLRPTIKSPIKAFTSIIECFDTIDNALPNQLDGRFILCALL